MKKQERNAENKNRNETLGKKEDGISEKKEEGNSGEKRGRKIQRKKRKKNLGKKEEGNSEKRKETLTILKP